MFVLLYILFFFYLFFYNSEQMNWPVERISTFVCNVRTGFNDFCYFLSFFKYFFSFFNFCSTFFPCFSQQCVCMCVEIVCWRCTTEENIYIFLKNKKKKQPSSFWNEIKINSWLNSAIEIFFVLEYLFEMK